MESLKMNVSKYKENINLWRSVVSKRMKVGKRRLHCFSESSEWLNRSVCPLA